MTFLDRVRFLSGSHDIPKQELEAELPEATYAAISAIPEGLLTNFAKKVEITDEGVELGIEDQVVEVRGPLGRRAFRISPEELPRYSRGDRGRCVYFIEEGTLHIHPEKGTAYIYRPEVPSPEDELTGEDRPHVIGELIAAFAGVQYLESLAHRERGKLPEIDVEAELGEPPYFSPVEFEKVDVVGIDEVAIEALPDAPTFSFEGGEMPAVPSMPTLPSEPTFPEGISPDVTFPEVPTYDAPTPPTLDFSKWTDFYNAEDPEMMNAALGELQVRLEEYSQEVQERLGSFSSKIQAYSAEIQGLARITETEATIFRSQIEGYAAEISGTVQRYSAEVQGITRIFEAEAGVKQAFEQIRLQAARNHMEAGLAEYQAEVQKRIEQARLEVQRVSQAAQMEQDIHLQNEIRRVETRLQNHSIRLERYGAKLSRYQTEVQAELQKSEMKLQRADMSVRMISHDINRLKGRIERLSEQIMARYRSESRIRVANTGF